MLVQDARSVDDSTATISFEELLAWKRRRQQLFDGFAFYRVEQGRVAAAGQPPRRAQIARGTLNLFTLLGLPVRFAVAGRGDDNHPGVVLSDEFWQNEFGGDQQIAGRIIKVGSQKAVVLGIAPADSWRLPDKVDMWLLANDEAIPPEGLGFAVAHLKPPLDHSRSKERWPMSVPKPDGGTDDYVCVPVAERTRGPFGVFLFTLGLACLALPATTSLPLGQYPANSCKLSRRTRLKRWSFLLTKLVLLLPVVYFVSLDLAHVRTSFDPSVSEYIQIVSSFSICLFGLRWVLRDQRRRCPVCLGRLTHSARVGEPSRTFLSWNGTELICVGGHGLLHVPEIQTSWFSAQRWLYLDSSWNVLFAKQDFTSGAYL